MGSRGIKIAAEGRVGRGDKHRSSTVRVIKGDSEREVGFPKNVKNSPSLPVAKRPKTGIWGTGKILSIRLGRLKKREYTPPMGNLGLS